MLGWVITCHDDRAQEILDALEKKHGALLQCRAVNFWRGLSSNMLSRMMCDARHCCKVSDEAAFCLIQRPYISKTLLTRRISPRGSP